MSRSEYFNNSNAMTKIRLRSHNLAKSTVKWYNPQEYINICKNYEIREREN